MTRPLIIGMSKAGSCIRKQFCEITKVEGEAPPPWLAETALEGTLHEMAIKAKLRGEGYKVTECGECPECSRIGIQRSGIHVEVPLDGILFVGHMDGLVTAPGANDETVLEVKSMSMFEFQRWKREYMEGFYTYKVQIAMYLQASGKERAYYLVKDRNGGQIDRQYFYAHEFEGLVGKTAAKIKVLQEALANNEMPGAEYDPSTSECKYCLWKAGCIKESERYDEATKEELDEATEGWYRGNRMVQEGEKMMKDCKLIFERHVRSRNIKKFFYGGLVTNYVTVKEGISYPKWKLEEKIPKDILALAAEKKKGYSFVKVEEVEK